jgi:hypothetical protein
MIRIRKEREATDYAIQNKDNKSIEILKGLIGDHDTDINY